MLLTTMTSLNNYKMSKEKYTLLQTLTSNSKDIYNKSLYTIRQHFFNQHTFLKFKDNYTTLMSSYNIDNTYIEYYRLQTNCSQNTIKCVDKAFKSFFSLLAKKKSNTYDKKVSIPKYLHKNGYYKVIFTKSAFKIHGKYIKLSLPTYLQKQGEELWFTIPHNIINKNSIQEVHLLPNGNGTQFRLAFIYQSNSNSVILNEENENLNANEVSSEYTQSFMSIDLGINNLVTMVNSRDGQSILIDGSNIKSMNRYFNKKISKLQSINKTNYDSYQSHQMSKLYTKRNNTMKDVMHKIATYVIRYCMDNHLKKIVIGHNKEWKQDINIGNRNNQNFMNIPHSILIDYIMYKGTMNDIKVIVMEESYTSKCDSLSLEPLPTYDKNTIAISNVNMNPLTKQPYYGKRIKRGLFQSKTNILINADVNGALNIARKYLTNFNNIIINNDNKCKQNSHEYEYIQRILSSGLVFNPIKIRL